MAFTPLENDDSNRSGSDLDEPVHTIPEARRLTRARVRDLGALLSGYARRHLPPVEERVRETIVPPRVTGRHALALRYLRFIPATLAALFVVSFIWDFDGVSVRLFSRTLTVEGLLRLTSVSGLIGFLTNWLAISMLFRPRQRRPIFGQGLVPAQRERVIYRLAEAVTTELINEEIIKAKIQESGVISRYREIGLQVSRGILEDPEFREDLRTVVVDYIARVVRSEEVRTRLAEIAVQKLKTYAGEGLSGIALRLYRYFNEEDFQARIDKAVDEIPHALDALLDTSDAFLDTLPDRIEEHAEDIERFVTRTILSFVGQLDIYGMIRSNMEQYDEQRLEQLLKTSTNEQLNYIKYLGGVLGFFGGFVIWQPGLALTVFVLIGGGLALLDVLLYRRREGETTSGAPGDAAS